MASRGVLSPEAVLAEFSKLLKIGLFQVCITSQDLAINLKLTL